MKRAQLALGPCDSTSCVKIRKSGQKQRPTPPPRTTNTYLWTSKFYKAGMQPVIVSRWDPVQPITVCVCETAPLKSTVVLPLVCPTRLARSRVWLRRTGPTYSHYYATLSGWRLWDEMPFTKNSFSKTSIRFVIHSLETLLGAIYCTVWNPVQQLWHEFHFSTRFLVFLKLAKIIMFITGIIVGGGVVFLMFWLPRRFIRGPKY